MNLVSVVLELLVVITHWSTPGMFHGSYRLGQHVHLLKID